MAFTASTKRDTRLRVAVIVNDMNEVNIDTSLIERSAANAGAASSHTKEKMAEMSHGFICCTRREDLRLDVRKLPSEGRFDHLLIKSTGIGDPMPVAGVQDNRTQTPLLNEQIEFADVVDVKKNEKVDTAQLNEVAEIVYAEHGKAPLRQMLAIGRFDLASAIIERA